MKWRDLISELAIFYGTAAMFVILLACLIQLIMGFMGCFI